MDDQSIVHLIAGIIIAYLAGHVLTRRFDPFAPVWLFLVGYIQVYVVQATSYREWAVNTRGIGLVTSANFRALWALLWYLAVYHMPIGAWLARRLPSAPRSWPPSLIAAMAPPLILWGLYCSKLSIGGGSQMEELTPTQVLILSFAFLTMVAAILLIVTGRSVEAPRPAFLIAGLATAGLYIMIWMFNGKRSPALIGVLSTVCAWYITRLRRPSWPVLAATGCAGVLVVAIAIGWRNNPNYESSVGGFVQYLSEFNPQKVLESLNIAEDEEDKDFVTHESTEYGGFILMMDTVPMKSEYDYGANYIRTFSTFIPRLVWPDKPIFGRAKWQAAWVAGSEIDREEDFTSPAIGILGATQLNGGALGTLIVIFCAALLQRTAYAFFLHYQDRPWVQFWWAISYFNAWFMVVNDDPMVWFYYNWGYTTFPIVALLWFGCRFADSQTAA